MWIDIVPFDLANVEQRKWFDHPLLYISTDKIDALVKKKKVI